MAKFGWDHIHLRSPNPEATAAFYERMFGAEVIRTMQQGKPRIDLKVGGANVFIIEVAPDGKTAPPPLSPYQGLDHFGLTVTGIEASSPSSRPREPSSRWSPRPSAPARASPSCGDRSSVHRIARAHARLIRTEIGMYPFDDAFRRDVAARCAEFPRLVASDAANGLKHSAVCITLLETEDGSGATGFLLTRRAEGLRSHGGQWALPGGRCDPSETLVAAALRELGEEVGLELTRVPNVLGILDDYPTRSGYCVTPVVLWAGKILI